MKAPRFSAAGIRLSQLVAMAKQIATAQQQMPAHRRAETAAVLTLPVLLLLGACAAEPAAPPPASQPTHHPYHERQSHLRWQDSED